MTVITQQYQAYLSEQRQRPENVRRHFIRDLTRFIASRKRLKEHIVLYGDFNETIGNSNTGMTRLCHRFNLVDAIQHSHGHPEGHFSTYIDGTKILDYVLIDHDLLPAVTACGYEPFLATVHGNHRGLFIDFDTTTLFGAPNTQLAPKTHRQLQSGNPKHITTYLQHKIAYLRDHNFFSRIQQLKNGRNPKLAEKLDRTMTAASLHAEQQLPTYPNVPYSPKIANLRNTLGVYRMLLYQHNHGIDLDPQIQASLHKSYDFQTLPTTLEECTVLYKTTLKELKQLERTEREKSTQRNKHLDDQIAKQEGNGDKQAAQRIIRIKQCEDTARVFRKCAHARGKTRSNGFASIQVPLDPTIHPKQCTQWRTIDCPQEIEQTLLSRNQKHFSQAQGTPLTLPPLSQEINFEASTATTDLILNGSYTHEDLDNTTQMMIDYLQRVSAPSVDSNISEPEFEAKIKNWKERTTTSPSGVHLGHYKAYYADHSLDPESDSGQQLDQDRDTMLEAQMTLLNYAIDHGHSYTRWQKIATMMIEKEPGNHKIHRLRVIHLYEADYNLLLCVKWRNALHHAADNNLINFAQHGGNPGHNAPDVVLVEELEYEICRATRTSLGKFDNDATSCYDRIHCFLANICSQKYGLDRKICIVQGKTLREAQYHLKTQLGVSLGSIQHCETHPIYGTGQGSGNSPVYWLFISSTLFDCHATKAHGARFSTPDRAITLTLYMLGFVDDTSNRTNHFELDQQPNAQQLLKLMSHDAQLWHDLLWSSGGELELPKCTFHHIRFEYNPMGRPQMMTGHFSPDLFVTTQEGNQIKIKQLSNHDSHKLLGCHKEPIGSQIKQLQVLQKQSKDFSRVVSGSTLDRHESNIFYFHIYIPSISYPLSTAFFTDHQLDT